jgi:predicted alpha/beta superfamily hydrolase
MNLSVKNLLLSVSCILFSICGRSQIVSHDTDSLGPFCLKNIDTWSIHSTTIGEDYTLYVLRTAIYDTTDIKLPVLYMTDGDWNMTVAMNCFSMLRQDYNTHEPLVVGIGYGKGKNLRMRDLDPSTGGPAFLTFIEKEVMPFIGKKYRINDGKAIYGYSMGGMFTTYILFHRPDLFDMVFIGAPGNNGNQLMPSAEEYFKDHKDLKSKVFIGVGSYENEVVRNINEFTDYLLSLKCPGLAIRKAFTPGAGHGAALAQVMQNAIAYGYCDRHEAIMVDPSVLNQYTGKYVIENKSTPDVLIFTDKNKLYWKFTSEGSTPTELLPISKTEYFMAENEKILFTFKKEEGKMKMVVVPDNNSSFIFTREE